MGVPRNDVDSGVIDWSTLKSVFGQPVEYNRFTEVAGDLRMSGALVDLHNLFRLTIGVSGAAAKRDREAPRYPRRSLLVGVRRKTARSTRNIALP